MIIFVLANAAALYYLNGPTLARVITRLNGLTFIILAIGTFRLTDIVTHEKVTEPLRAIFRDGDTAAKGGLRGFLGQLFDCNSCLGV